MRTNRYIVSYIGYQHASIGDDDACDGWQNFYTHYIFENEKLAVDYARKLTKDRFVKDIFVSKEFLLILD